jgi:hypothetical protein
MSRVGALSILICSTASAQWADAERVGPNRQPVWTTQRAFAGPSVYVAPPLALSYELRLETRAPFEGLSSIAELSLGLPLRFQLAAKVGLEHSTRAPVGNPSMQLELRWALAPWEVLPWNPTLYLEWRLPREGRQTLEARLLLGGNITDRWYWGGHFFFQRELGDRQTHVYGLTGSVSYSLKERTLSLGGGYRIEATDIRDERFRARRVDLLTGPTLSVSPLEGLNVLLAAFLGPGLRRDDVTQEFRVTFALRPTVVGAWRF